MKKRNPRANDGTSSDGVCEFRSCFVGGLLWNAKQTHTPTTQTLVAPIVASIVSVALHSLPGIITFKFVTQLVSNHRRREKRIEELAAMDYTLAAVKMHIAQLKPAKPAKEARPNGGTAFTLGSLVFQRAWLQGVLVPGSEKASLALQDGTGVLPIQLAAGESGTVGTYVLIVGAYLLGADGSPYLLVHKKVDLPSERAEFWRLEVAEAHNLFYDKLTNAPTP